MSRLGPRGKPRRGFTVTEIVVAFLVLAVAMLIVGQLGVYALRARSQSLHRHEALEFAANLLEVARAEPWENLTPEWAAGHALPETLAALPESRLDVRVAPEEDRPLVKRVTVEVSWEQPEGSRRAQQLVGLFAARAATVGGKP